MSIPSRFMRRLLRSAEVYPTGFDAQIKSIDAGCALTSGNPLRLIQLFPDARIGDSSRERSGIVGVCLTWNVQLVISREVGHRDGVP